MLFIKIISYVSIALGCLSTIYGIIALLKHKEKKYQAMYREYLKQKSDVEHQIEQMKREISQ